MAVDFPGLRQNGSSSQIINQAQDFPEQASRHGNLGQLERDVPAMADHFSTDLDQLLPECRQRPVLDLLEQHRLLLLAKNGSPNYLRDTSGLPPTADILDSTGIVSS